MPRPLTLCDWAGVEILLGGAQEATKLLDPNRVGLQRPDFQTKALQYGCTRVLEAYGVQNQIASLNPPFDPSLVQRAEIASAVWAWDIGTGGQAMPPGLERMSAQLDAALEMWTSRRRNPAQDPEAPNQHLITQVVPSSEWTRDKLAVAGYG
jgi:hypothetical protein